MKSVIETKRLYLRRWNEEDVDVLYELCKDPDIGPNCGWRPHKSKEGSKESLNILSNEYTFAIVLKETDEAIGNISLSPASESKLCEQDAEGEIGFWLGKPYWGNGYMREACLALLAYGFETKQLERIWCAHMLENQKSHRVQMACGFLYHHTIDHRYNKLLDRYETIIVNCLTKSEWKNKREG